MEADLGQFLLRNLNALDARSTVKAGLDRQPGFHCGAANQLHDDLAAQQGLSAPVASNMAKQTMFDLAPLARSRWKVTNAQLQACFVGESLQSHLPQTRSCAVDGTRGYSCLFASASFMTRTMAHSRCRGTVTIVSDP